MGARLRVFLTRDQDKTLLNLRTTKLCNKSQAAAVLKPYSRSVLLPPE